MKGEPSLSVKGFPQYYHIQGHCHWHQWHFRTMKKY
jgi:hypothetical protein